MRAHIISSNTGSFAVLLPAPLLLRALRLVGDLCPPPWSCEDQYGSMGSCKLTPGQAVKSCGEQCAQEQQMLKEQQMQAAGGGGVPEQTDQCSDLIRIKRFTLSIGVYQCSESSPWRNRATTSGYSCYSHETHEIRTAVCKTRVKRSIYVICCLKWSNLSSEC